MKRQRPKLQDQIKALPMALEYVTDWRVAVDGGANIGEWAAAMAERFETVHAFEPQKICPKGNYILHRAALMDKPGTVSMTVKPKKLGCTRSYYAIRGDDVPAMTIDGLGLESCGFIKLDLEGAELLALRGAEQTVERFRPVLLIEFDRSTLRRYGHRPGDLIAWLQARGYQKVAEFWLDFVYVWRH